MSHPEAVVRVPGRCVVLRREHGCANAPSAACRPGASVLPQTRGQLLASEFSVRGGHSVLSCWTLRGLPWPRAAPLPHVWAMLPAPADMSVACAHGKSAGVGRSAQTPGSATCDQSLLFRRSRERTSVRLSVSSVGQDPRHCVAPCLPEGPTRLAPRVSAGVRVWSLGASA